MRQARIIYSTAFNLDILATRTENTKLEVALTMRMPMSLVVQKMGISTVGIWWM
jgi:hypothetical protein